MNTVIVSSEIQMIHFRNILMALGILFAWTPVHAEQVHVGVAANFAAPFQEIAGQFHAKTGHDLVPSFGSSGKLYAQIVNGAPYQVFLSADVERARALEEESQTVPGSRFTYAIGRLVLWSAQPGYVDGKGEVLARGGFNRLSIANPKTAPYGFAAQQVLERLGLWESLKDRLVQGESITQAFQFAATGNAALGFVALAQVKDLPPSQSGSIWLVPQNFYDPIEQQAVLLKKGEGSTAVLAFMDYLRGEKARTLIARYGYAVP